MSIVHTSKSGNKNLPRMFITVLSSPRILNFGNRGPLQRTSAEMLAMTQATQSLFEVSKVSSIYERAAVSGIIYHKKRLWLVSPPISLKPRYRCQL